MNRNADKYDDSSADGGGDDDSRSDVKHSSSSRKEKKSRKRSDYDDSSSDTTTSPDRKKRRKKKKHSSKKHKSKRKKRRSDDDDNEDMVENERLQQKLDARGETLEERNERRAKKRAAHISSKFGYTADANPFNDPNLHEKFTWKKASNKKKAGAMDAFDEIEKVRKRRTDHEDEMRERERARAEESRVREQEHYDDWAAKEEAFHLEQQRQRSAIRLVEGREKPIDVLAKNILMFGLTDQDQANRSKVKYQERYSALNEIGSLEVELEEPGELLQVLKLDELKVLRLDVLDFYRLEKEAVLYGQENGTNPSTTVLEYWENVRVLVENEIDQLQRKESAPKVSNEEVSSIFVGQSQEELQKMKIEISTKLQNPSEDMDRGYWVLVLAQLSVHLARQELSKLHSRMLVRQLEKLQEKKAELDISKDNGDEKLPPEDDGDSGKVPGNVEPGFGDQEDENAEEVELTLPSSDGALKKPRYFNRVRTGYDWNKYNQTHYDQDNPPPKTVQGYKFNIFYPDLDPSISPRFTLEAADTPEFCIIRFSAGTPYEDIAFKIVNREWNRSRKKGFNCTFERGILSLYFNFTTYWYRK